MPRKRRRRDPNRYPLSVRDRVEIDYARKLSEAQKEWLAAFNEAEYGANPAELRFITGRCVTRAQLRKAWREIQRYKRDLLTGWANRSVAGPNSPAEESPEDLLIHQIDNAGAIEREIMKMLKESILLRDWRKCGKV